MDIIEQRQILEDWLGHHRGVLFRVVRSYAFTAQDREDLFQEIVIQTWHSIPRFRAECAIPTWLYRIALNCAHTWTRSESRHRHRLSHDFASDTALTEPSAEADPRLGWLYEQIGRMDHIDRSLTLLMLDGFSYRQMAEILGISVSNVGVKLNRIRAHLIEATHEENRHGS